MDSADHLSMSSYTIGFHAQNSSLKSDKMKTSKVQLSSFHDLNGGHAESKVIQATTRSTSQTIVTRVVTR